MDITAQIQTLEAEIAQSAEIEASLQRYVNREKPGEHKDLVADKLRRHTARLDYIEAELGELYALRRLQIARERRHAAAVAMANPVRTVKITEIQEVTG